jgi:hypothetical protein
VFIPYAAETMPKNNSPGTRAGVMMCECLSRRVCRLELPVFSQHLAAGITDPPAIGSKRRAAAQKIAPRYAGGMVAQSCGGRSARREFSEIDGSCLRRPDTEQQAGSEQHFHAVEFPSILA